MAFLLDVESNKNVLIHLQLIEDWRLPESSVKVNDRFSSSSHWIEQFDSVIAAPSLFNNVSNNL